MRVMNETMMLALTSILSAVSLAEEMKLADAPQEFFEVDMTKTSGKRFVEFGTRLFSNDDEINEEFLKKLGPALTTVMWGAIWEVSSAAPAPHSEGDQRLKDWVDTVYMNLKYYMDSMRNTSELLRKNDIALINSFTNPPNAYYATPNQIERIRKNVTWEEAKEELEQATEGDSYQMLMSDRADSFAKFWIFSLEYVKNEGFTIPYFEISDEPDNKEGSVYITPEDWVQAVKAISSGIKESSEDKYGIVGPATSNPTAAKEYVQLLGKDREAYDAISKWSFRIWDDGSSLMSLEKSILGFGKLAKTAIPSDWPKKPIVVYLGLRFNSYEFAGDYEFSGDILNCYKQLYGMKIRESDYITTSIAQSPAVGVRLLADMFVLYSHGVRTVVYDAMLDHNWSHSCNGLFDREGRPKQLYAALSTFLPYLTQDMKVTKKQWKNSEECVMVSFQSESRLIYGVANLGSTSCTRSLSISGIDPLKIRRAHSISYNNGTVSLKAEEAFQALINENDVRYDVYEDEEENAQKKTVVVEFDVTVISKASATVVFELGDAPPQEVEEQVEEIVIDAVVEESDSNKKEPTHGEL